MISDVQIFPSRVLQLCATCFWLCFFRWPELQQGFDMQRWHLIFISFDIPKQIPGLNGFNIISWDFMGFDIPQKNIYKAFSQQSARLRAAQIVPCWGRFSNIWVVEAAAREGSEDDEQLPRTRLSESPGCDEKLPSEREIGADGVFWMFLIGIFNDRDESH